MRACSMATAHMISSECPPRSRKLSCAPMRFDAEQFAPDCWRQGVRSACPGSREPSRHRPSPLAPRRAGSARRSTLPFGVIRNAPRATQADGTMYSGEVGAQECARGGALPRAGSRRHVGGQALVAAATLGGNDHRLGHAGMAGQHRSISPSLDPVAAQLDLVVSAAEDSAPVAAPAARSPVRYRRAPGRRPKRSGTNLSAVSSGRPW